MKREKNKTSKLAMKKERLQETVQKYKVQETDMNNSMKTKWITWREWRDAQLRSVQFISVTQSCPTLCDPMNRSTPGLPVHHQILEFTETHTHRVCDAFQPSHPLSSPSPPVPNPSQHQGIFQ